MRQVFVFSNRFGLAMLMLLLAVLLSHPSVAAMGTLSTDSSPPFAVSAIPGNQLGPRLAYNSSQNEYLVVWSDSRLGGSNEETYGQRVASNGTLVGTEILIGTGPNDQGVWAVQYNATADEYLVIFSDTRNQSSTHKVDLWGQRVAADGTLIGSNFPVRATANASSSASLAYNSDTGQYLLVWNEIGFAGGTYWDVAAMILDVNGSPGGSAFAIQLSAIGGNVAYSANSGEYLVAYTVATSGAVCPGDTLIYSRRISSAGAPTGTPVLIASPHNCSSSSLVHNNSAGGYLFAWSPSWGFLPGTDIFAHRLAEDGSPLGGTISIATTSGPEYAPQVTHNDISNEYLIIWSDFRNGGAVWDGVSGDIFGLRLAEDGTPLGSEFDITQDPNTSAQFSSAVAYNLTDNNYLAVWNDNRNGNDYDIYGSVVNPYVPPNAPPVLTVENLQIQVQEGQTANNTGTVYDPDGDIVSLHASIGTIDHTGNDAWLWSFLTNDGPIESQQVTIWADDGRGGTAEISFALMVDNAPPTVHMPAVTPELSEEGSSGTATATFTDPSIGDGPFTCRVDYGDGAGFQAGMVSGTTCTGVEHTYVQDGIYPVTIEVTDKDNDSGLSSVAFHSVTNALPLVGPISITPDPPVIEVGATVTATANFTDLGIEDPHIATWDWGDNTFDIVNPAFSPVASTHTYTAPGVYTISLTVTDDNGTSAPVFYQFIVVYDPQGGFVTGGGWIDSPVGAYSDNPLLTGQAHFGFTSRYKNGATVPTGQTRFRFRVANLAFESDSYEWLVVNQGGANAQFKGSGTINDELAPNGEPFKFMIWAGDINPDTVRIRIWWENGGNEIVIYDNGFDQTINNGQIQIQN